MGLFKKNRALGFCPLRSTADREVECSQNCAWYVESEENDTTCEMNLLTENLMKISEALNSSDEE